MGRPRFGSDIGGWGAVPLWVVTQANAPAVRLFALLSGRYADRDKITPSRQQLAADLGLSDLKSVDASLRMLIDIGAVVATQHCGAPRELSLNYSRPHLRGQTDRGYGVDPTPPMGFTPHHNQESFQESSQEVQRLRKDAEKKRSHRRHAYCGQRFCVPDFLHEQFERQLGSERDQIDLLDVETGWYATIDRESTGAIADDPLQWLRKRFTAALKAEFGD